VFLTGFVYYTAEAIEARFKGERAGFLYFALLPIPRLDVRAGDDRTRGAEARAPPPQPRAAVDQAMLAPLKPAGSRGCSPRPRSDRARYVVEDCCRVTALPPPRMAIGLDSTSAQGDAPEHKSALLESPTNPTLGVLESPRSRKSRKRGGREAADRRHCCLRRDLAEPADIGRRSLVYSATAYRRTGKRHRGIIISSEAFIARSIHTFMRQTGLVDSRRQRPGSLLKGLEKLAIRVRAQNETASGGGWRRRWRSIRKSRG